MRAPNKNKHVGGEGDSPTGGSERGGKTGR